MWPDAGGYFLWPVDGITDVLKIHGSAISHRAHGFRRRRRLLEYLELRNMRKIPHWIGVSVWFNDEWRTYAQATPLNETIVYNPVDTSVFIPSGVRNAHMVFYSGGLRRRKGVLALARAAKIFLKEVPGATLQLATFQADVKYFATNHRQIDITCFQNENHARYQQSVALWVPAGSLPHGALRETGCAGSEDRTRPGKGATLASEPERRSRWHTVSRTRHMADLPHSPPEPVER